MIEFVNTSLADLFSVSTSKDYTVDVVSKPTVTTEVMQLKRSMYDDPQGFIFKHFEVLCNLLKSFGEYDESLKISALKVLLQVSEKITSILSTFLDDKEFDQEELFKKRNTFKMAVFLLCHFANAFEKQLSQKLTSANIEKGKKKKAISSSDISEWPELRVKFVVVVKKLFKLPINRLWDPPYVDPEFVNFVTITFFKLLERAEVAKDKGMRAEIFRFLGTVLTEYRIGLAFSVKMIQLVQDFEHLSSVLAEGVVYFVKECSADTLISDILKEANLLDVDVLTQNLTAAHSLSQFLVSIAEECPEKFLPLVSIVLQFLEWESHVMRNCALSILGVLLSKTLCSVNLSQKEKKMREELLGQIEEYLLDGNSFVRCRCIQVLKMLMETKALASFELHIIGQKITKRLQDKASNVRKNAMTFMAEFVHENQCSCQVPLPVLRGSFETALEELKELKKKIPVIFEDSEEEEVPDKEKVNGVIFSDSEDDDDVAADKEREKDEAVPLPSSEQSKENGEHHSEDTVANSEDKPENKLQKNIPPSNDVETLKQQQNKVNYLKNTLNFAEVIHGILEPIRSLLYSSTQTDVLESIEFIIAIVNNSVKGSDIGIKEVLKLIWSKEAAIIEAVRNAFKTLYLSNGQDKCEPMEIAKNLIELLKGASTDDALNVQECVKYFSQQNEIPKAVSNILWSSFSNPNSELTEEEKISILQLLGMLTEIHPETILMRFDNFVEIGLGNSAENSFLSAMYVFKTLGKINHNVRGKITPQEVIHFPHTHLLVSRIKYFLIDGFRNYEDNQWTCMAQEAVFTIFSLIEDPDLLCAEISKTLSNILLEEIHIEKMDGVNNDDENIHQQLSHILLSRFLTFCGNVAIHYNSYLKVDHFTYLRKQEAIREKRRRRSSVHNNVSFHSTSFLSPTGKSSRKRKSIINNKRYKLLPPVDEETTYEQIIEMCANSVQSDEKLVGALLLPVILSCRWTLKVFNKEIQAAASLSLAKFMLLSEKVCQENMQLFATIAEKSPEAYIRANMIIAMGDLATAYPNIVEPWTQQIFQRLKDSDSLVRENAIIILTHLILHDFVRIKALISDAAKCIADANPSISVVAKYLFAELSKKGNVIYNIIPDIISSLSDPKSGVNEEIFQTVMSCMLQYVEKEKLIEGLVEKLCCRFTESNTEVQIHELTFCLSILTLNDKCYRKLMEFKTLLKERMSDPVVMRYITNIMANSKKNDAKTAAELEMFKNELGL